MDTENGSLDFQGEFAVPLDELRAAHEDTLPRHFG